MYSSPLIELVKPYPATEDVATVFQRIGKPAKIGEELTRIVFGDNYKLRKHQAETLLISLAEEPDEPKNVVVNTGTGSRQNRMLHAALNWSPPLGKGDERFARRIEQMVEQRSKHKRCLA